MAPLKIKVLLVEDDELFRLGLQVRLQQEENLEIVAEATDGETAIELVNSYQLDVVLLDIGLPGIGGMETCRIIKQNHPQLPVLILSSHSEQSLLMQIIEAGAQGYCLKGINPEKLVLALRSVASGASWWDEKATQEIRFAFAARAQPDVIKSSPVQNILTQREQEILILIAANQTNQQIADKLYITPGTVRVHVHAILHKLGASTRTEAVTIAIAKGMIRGNRAN
ncbi:DNA-binding response regulator [Dulcicalothrix desertica PCC 7102]|uniref:DNA-binding response regulator n=1 Tax=Dulcicalothrix desertica PCC 7102 TaxID=232991 RepID=A0A433VSE7_9CYAN|nr:response regulator transcription factor [Dulcicalothrix desertica]RUT09004.1 DNA-binding response regulator [Dulcicalothrix desertica PCC 7102]TWH49888.1 LuxR family two component transcriptional regulator [Dulcicalothrix desertica PCC 7102]